MSDDFDHMADAFEQLIAGFENEDEGDEDFWLKQQYSITCKYCQRPLLRWQQAHERWYLVERDGTTHVCPPKPGEPQP